MIAGIVCSTHHQTQTPDKKPIWVVGFWLYRIIVTLTVSYLNISIYYWTDIILRMFSLELFIDFGISVRVSIFSFVIT